MLIGIDYLFNSHMPDKLYQVYQMASILNSNGKILLVYIDGEEENGYTTPGASLEVGEDYEESLRRGVKEMTGLEAIKIDGPLYTQNFQVGKSETLTFTHAHYGIWFACQTEAVEVNAECRHMWVSENDDLSGIKFYHPLDVMVLKKHWGLARMMKK